MHPRYLVPGYILLASLGAIALVQALRRTLPPGARPARGTGARPGPAAGDAAPHQGARRGQRRHRDRARTQPVGDRRRCGVQTAGSMRSPGISGTSGPRCSAPSRSPTISGGRRAGYSASPIAATRGARPSSPACSPAAGSTSPASATRCSATRRCCCSCARPWCAPVRPRGDPAARRARSHLLHRRTARSRRRPRQPIGTGTGRRHDAPALVGNGGDRPAIWTRTLAAPPDRTPHFAATNPGRNDARDDGRGLPHHPGRTRRGTGAARRRARRHGTSGPRSSRPPRRRLRA